MLRHASLMVQVHASLLACMLAGGTRRTVRRTSVLTLDATGSFDPDEPEALLSFEWACVEVQAEAASMRCTARSTTARSTLRNWFYNCRKYSEAVTWLLRLYKNNP